MGSLSEDIVKIGLGGLIVSGLVHEIKKDRTCDYCGRSIKKGSKAGMCQATHWDLKEGYVCSKCMRLCKKCKRIFCPEHIKNHRCNSDNNEEEWTCGHCNKKFILMKKEQKELEKKGEIKVECPHCNKETICEE